MYAELKENHPHGTREYPFCEYHMRYWPHAFQIPVHWHDEVEIIYVRKGPLMVEIDGQKFIGDDGAVYIVSPGVLHMMAAPETPVDYFTFLFPIRHFRSEFPCVIPKREKYLILQFILGLK